jgi:hypothetical protein
LKAPPEAEVSPPQERADERYKRKVKYMINKRKEQLSKESEKRAIAKREDSCELEKELENLNRQLENGGLSESEASVMRTKKKLIWKRINNLKNAGRNTDPPRYATRSQTAPDVLILPPLPPAP